MLASTSWNLRSLFRYDEVAGWIEFISPEPSDPEWLIPEFRTQMSIESAANNENARRTPSKRHNGRPLVTDMMDSCYERLTPKNEVLCFSLNLIERSFGMTIRPKGFVDHHEVGFEESGVAVEPEASRFIETRFLVEGRRSARWS